MLEVGQNILMRGVTWQVEEVSELGNSYKLVVKAKEGPLNGKKVTCIASLEDIKVLDSAQVKFTVPTNPEYWKYFVDAINYSLTHSNKFLLSIFNSRIKIERYQLIPLIRIKKLLKPRILIADDVGLGKTVEAGLILMELIARNKANRVLIVTPASLQEQWQDELKDKFNLDFEIFDSSRIREISSKIQTGINPWEAYDRIITSIDYIKREDVFRKIETVKWDVVIVDEAHYLSYVHNKTDRARFGEKISKRCESLILLTATPHSGRPESFRSILRLLDERLVRPNGELSKDAKLYFVRRLKSQILEDSGDRTFKEPEIRIIDVEFKSDLEKKIYKELAKYADRYYKKAIRIREAQSVAFAMVILKKRLMSSLEALRCSLEYRIENLENLRYQMDTVLKRSYIEGVSLTERQIEKVEADVLRTTLETSIEGIEKEKRRLEKILRMVEQALVVGDSKAYKILEILREETDDNEKVIIFTEYRDTQRYLYDFLSRNGYEGRITLLNGMMSSRQRKEADRFFNSPDCKILIATDAASEGLNFQKNCSIIIHNELPWNPNRLEQRNGRVDRWGQKRRVRIYNLHLVDSYESDILKLLITKLIDIRRDTGSVTDVLGIFKKEKLIDELMGKETKDEVEEAQKKLDGYIREILATYNKEIRNLALFGHTKEEEEEVESTINSTRTELPDFTDLKGLTEHMIRKHGGRIEEIAPEIYRIEVPQNLRYSGVESLYEKATFSRKVALMDGSVEFLTLTHPLISGVLREYRRLLYRHVNDYRVTYKVVEGFPLGILFVHLVKLQNGYGKVVEERLVPIFVNLEEDKVEDEYTAAKALAAESLKINAPPEFLKENFENKWELALNLSFDAIESIAIRLAEELAASLSSMVEKEKRDVEDYVETKIRKLEAERRSIQATLLGANPAEGRDAKLRNRRITSEIESLRKNADMRCRDLEKIGEISVRRSNGKASEVISAAMIIPMGALS